MKSLIIGVLLFPLLSFAPKEPVNTEAVTEPSTVEQDCQCPANPGLGLIWYRIDPPDETPDAPTTCRLIMFKKSLPGLPVRTIVEIPARCN